MSTNHPRRVRFTVRALMMGVGWFAVGFGVLRALVSYPQMLGAFVPLGIVVGVIVALDRLESVRSDRTRFSLGCCLLPAAMMTLGLGVSILVIYLHHA